jgi:hypothetical protein
MRQLLLYNGATRTLKGATSSVARNLKTYGTRLRVTVTRVSVRCDVQERILQRRIALRTDTYFDELWCHAIKQVSQDHNRSESVNRPFT